MIQELPSVMYYVLINSLLIPVWIFNWWFERKLNIPVTKMRILLEGLIILPSPLFNFYIVYTWLK